MVAFEVRISFRFQVMVRDMVTLRLDIMVRIRIWVRVSVGIVISTKYVHRAYWYIRYFACIACGLSVLNTISHFEKPTITLICSSMYT